MCIRDRKIPTELRVEEEDTPLLARAVGLPPKPGLDVQHAHAASHTPFAGWCEDCVRGRAREDPHRRINKTDEQKEDETPVVQIDFAFFVTPIPNPQGIRRMDEVPKEMRVSRPILAMVNTKNGEGKALLLPNKASEEKYSAECVVKFLEEQGLVSGDADSPGVILQCDPESAVVAIQRAVLQRVKGAKPREAPKDSHES